MPKRKTKKAVVKEVVEEVVAPYLVEQSEKEQVQAHLAKLQRLEKELNEEGMTAPRLDVVQGQLIKRLTELGGV